MQLNITSHLHIEDDSANLKFRQLMNQIRGLVDTGVLNPGDQLPSINHLYFNINASRHTISKAYNFLVKTGVLKSFHGKGYFVQESQQTAGIAVCILFNNLSPNKTEIYSALASHSEEKIHFDLCVYENDAEQFVKILNRKLDKYAYYIITPGFIGSSDKAWEVINKIPSKKLIVLGKLIPEVRGDYSAVYEDFAMDLYQSLTSALGAICKYQTLKLIFPDNTHLSAEIKKGFKLFCGQHGIKNEILSDHDLAEISEGDAFITLQEEQLIGLIAKIQNHKFVPGKHVGIISYNELPVKTVISTGITTISADFKKMGIEAANIISQRIPNRVKVPFHLKMRNSL